VKIHCANGSVALMLAATMFSSAPHALAGETTLINWGLQGTFSVFGADNPSVSSDGRFVAFSSYASDLVEGDTNGVPDVFVHDRFTKKTVRVSVDSTGAQANDSGLYPDVAISADGRFVTFDSVATNLVPDDTNRNSDVFVHDMLTGVTECVSVDSTGKPARYPTSFNTAGSDSPAISGDGRYVLFHSSGVNLVGGDNNQLQDVFVRDRHTGTTTRVSVNSAGQQPTTEDTFFYSAISSDGRYAAFASRDPVFKPVDDHVTHVYVHDRELHTTTLVSRATDGTPGTADSGSPGLSADGRYVSFYSSASNLVSNDTNGSADMFVHDRVTGTVQRVSVASDGSQGARPSNDTGYFPGYPGEFSADGRFIAFQSSLLGLVEADTNGGADIFVHDRASGATTRASVDSAGNQPADDGQWSSQPVITADGRTVVFQSDSKLVPNDTHNGGDLYARDRLLVPTRAADIQLAVASQPAAIPVGQEGEYIYTVTNAGPAAVGVDVNLTSVTSNGKVVAMLPSRGKCFKSVVSVCRFGRLSANETVMLTVRVQAESDALVQQVSVAAPPVDGAPANNSARLTTAVTP